MSQHLSPLIAIAVLRYETYETTEEQDDSCNELGSGNKSRIETGQPILREVSSSPNHLFWLILVLTCTCQRVTERKAIPNSRIYRLLDV